MSNKGKERKEETEIEEVSGEKRKYPSWNERINGCEHKISPKMKRFILLFINKSEGKTAADFARHFKVNPSTIAMWLSYPEVKKEIERLQENNEARLMSLLESQQDEIISGLVKMFKDEKVNPETRRKIAYNLLSFGRVKDINTSGTLIQQTTAVVNKYENLSEEELDEQIRELDELDRG